MAIVKLTYTRGKAAMKAHLRYIVHRPGKERERLTRELFQHNYLRVTKPYAYALINGAPRGTVFYKMTLNFHPLTEDTHHDLDLHHLTSLTVREMQLRIGRSVPFIATIHHGHEKTELRHIHAICLVQGRMSKEAFATLKTLWQTATAEVRLQRRMRERVQARHRSRVLAQARVVYHSTTAKGRSLSQADAARKRSRGSRPFPLQHGCYHCGYGQVSGLPQGYTLCPCCHQPLEQEQTVRLELNRTL